MQPPNHPATGGRLSPPRPSDNQRGTAANNKNEEAMTTNHTDELKAAGFAEVQTIDGYTDFERYPTGYGEDGQDRTDRITAYAPDCFSVTIYFTDESGKNYKTVEKDDFKTVAAAIAFIDAQR